MHLPVVACNFLRLRAQILLPKKGDDTFLQYTVIYILRRHKQVVEETSLFLTCTGLATEALFLRHSFSHRSEPISTPDRYFPAPPCPFSRNNRRSLSSYSPTQFNQSRVSLV